MCSFSEKAAKLNVPKEFDLEKAELILKNYDNDSDETNGNFAPIGKDSSIAFKGIFDGNIHTQWLCRWNGGSLNF